MIVSHRDTPVGHSAIGLGGADLGKHLRRLFVSERVKQSDAAREFLLGWHAASSEMAPPS
jgi:hypothetical protein